MWRSALRIHPLAVVGTLSLAMTGFAAEMPSFGKVPLILDGNRVFVQMALVRPDGSIRNAIVNIDTGTVGTHICWNLFKELQLDQKKSLVLKIGEMQLQTDPADIRISYGGSFSIGSGLLVEAQMSPQAFRKYQVIFDYPNRTLTVALPGALKPEGIPVPCRIKKETGIISVAASIGGQEYQMAIDTGAAYTWISAPTVTEWVRAHPDWERGIGAVGPSNMMTVPYTGEASATVVRISEIKLASLSLPQIGGLGIELRQDSNPNFNFFDWYSEKNAVPVIGFLGGNVLKAFRLTIDYPNGVSYWLRESDSDLHDLVTVGLTLKNRGDAFFIAGIATQAGRPTVEGVEVGDELLQIDGHNMKGASPGALFSALHGQPGEVRNLTLERNGTKFEVKAKVASF